MGWMTDIGSAMGLTDVAGDAGDSWMGDALQPAMKGIMTAAMGAGRRTGGGQMVSAHASPINARGDMSGSQEIISLSGGDPLQGINQWSNLFK